MKKVSLQSFYKNKAKILLIIILLFAALTRIVRLDYPSGYVFDEVYHGFTAKEYLRGNPDAWDPWATPPSGVAYEWTHPPLAKEIMATSMYIAGSTHAWAWRLPGAILGVLSVFLIYLLGKSFFRNENIGLVSAFVFAIDGLNFVQSRTGMNDIYLVTFCLLSLLFFINKRFFYASLFLGFALASKWTAVYLLALYLFLILRYRHQESIKERLKNLLFALFIPPLVYLACYIPYFLSGFNISEFIELQKQMWGYHTGLKATHDYASSWWSWPFNLYPVWYHVNYYENSSANIFASGNLVVFLFGFVAIIATLIEYIRKRSAQLLIILLGYLVFLLPWALSPRISFLYHYSPSIPFMSIALGYQLNRLFVSKEYKILFFVCLLLMFLGFVLVFPFLTGMPIPKEITGFFFVTNLTKNPF